MRGLNRSEWAAIGERIATAGVVVSLLFVAYSVNRNTAAVQGTNENALFERHMALSDPIMLNPAVAELLLKMRGKNPQLTPIEIVQ